MAPRTPVSEPRFRIVYVNADIFVKDSQGEVDPIRCHNFATAQAIRNDLNVNGPKPKEPVVFSESEQAALERLRANKLNEQFSDAEINRLNFVKFRRPDAVAYREL